ncbi:serine hydrolase [Nocardia anaemiae]|uniref:serine hydrolase n=1 Tax=Nocardia anaemiae TaxID=263910 RepID=UPI0007A4F8A6|nr:serine hydrolase [Nocardia anaemiae]
MYFELSRRLRKAVGGTALAGLLMVAGCGTDADKPSAEPSITAAAAHTDQQQLSFTVPGTLAAGFQELQLSAHAKLGMAIMPVGGQKMVTFGDWTTGPAWSTMKVPLVIASQRKSSTSSSYAATAAITQSDNAAADTLWQSLGTAQEAAKAVEAVLREGGDAKTTVPATKTRSDASAFGQADWALAEQVRFASRLPCLQQSSNVIDLMEQITSSQRWGLGELTGAEFKGGWGPDTSGSYLVRQFGLIEGPGGRIAVAVATQPDSGALSDGISILDKLATVISQHLDELSGGSCS